MPVPRLFRLLLLVEALLVIAHPLGSTLSFDGLPRPIQEYSQQQAMAHLDSTVWQFGVGMLRIVLLLTALAGMTFHARFARPLWWAGLGLWAGGFLFLPVASEAGWADLLESLGFLVAGVLSGLLRHPEIRARFGDHSTSGRRRMKIALAVAGTVATLALGLGGWAILRVLAMLPPTAATPIPDELPLHRDSTTPEIVTQLDRLADAYLANPANAGLAIGVTRGRGRPRAFVARGTLSRKGKPIPMTADTLFEIGSVSKTFTALLAAEASLDGVIRLDQPVSEILGDAASPPPVTFLDLATHRAGFPKMPENLGVMRQFAANPYADYSEYDLFAAVSALDHGAPSPRPYAYSNLGFSLLAHSVARARGRSLADLHADLFSRLGLTNTWFTLPDDARERLATGHNRGLRVGHWHNGGALIQGAGSLVSSVADQLTWLEAQLDPPAGTLGEAVTLISTPQWRERGSGMGMGWHLRGEKAPIVWHNGATGGFRAITLWFPEPKLGVVVLGNSSDDAVDEMGFVLLRALLTTPPASPINPSK